MGGAPHRSGYGYGRLAVVPEAPGMGYDQMLASRTARGMGYTTSLYPLQGAKCGTCTACAEASLLRALEVDGRCVPGHLQASLTLPQIPTTEKVKVALKAMSNYTMPGLDGFTTEYFKLFAGRSARAAGVEPDGDGTEPVNPFLQLLTDALIESVQRPDGLPHEMREVVISLIYKEKGERDLLKNYRPIAVMPTLYKILTCTMAEALHGVMPWLVDNTGFQRGRWA